MAWTRVTILQPLGRRWKGFSNFMTAPLYAALLSLIVGKLTIILWHRANLLIRTVTACISPLQYQLDQMVPLRK
jgi:hypothetical protein